jgi:hypothetical protein
VRKALRLTGNMLAAFLAGDGVLALLMPQKQTLLWSPSWSPGPWRNALRWLSARPGLTRLLAALELTAGVVLGGMTNAEH